MRVEEFSKENTTPRENNSRRRDQVVKSLLGLKWADKCTLFYFEFIAQTCQVKEHLSIKVHICTLNVL
jgi:hypothetical protein